MIEIINVSWDNRIRAVDPRDEWAEIDAFKKSQIETNIERIKAAIVPVIVHKHKGPDSEDYTQYLETKSHLVAMTPEAFKDLCQICDSEKLSALFQKYEIEGEDVSTL